MEKNLQEGGCHPLGKYSTTPCHHHTEEQFRITRNKVIKSFLGLRNKHERYKLPLAQ